MSCCHFSYHGPQFWGIGVCLAMVKQYEQQQGFRYKWAARVRPDTLIGNRQYAAVTKAAAATAATAHTQGAVWFRKGGGSDCFAVMTRAALDGYRTIWDEFAGGCGSLGFTDPMEPANIEALGRICRPIGVNAWWGTECLIAAHLRRPEFGGVVVHADNAFAVQIIRPEGRASGINMGTG